MQIDGYVIPVREDKRDEYLDLAQWFDQAMIDHGAIEVFEGWELDGDRLSQGRRRERR